MISRSQAMIEVVKIMERTPVGDRMPVLLSALALFDPDLNPDDDPGDSHPRLEIVENG